jgi:hypothetical protein
MGVETGTATSCPRDLSQGDLCLLRSPLLPHRLREIRIQRGEDGTHEFFRQSF